MADFMIRYIEDNQYGVFQKQIIVESENFVACVREYTQKYPTLNKVEQLWGIKQSDRDYFSHKTQDLLQASQQEMGRSIQEKFKWVNFEDEK